MGMHVYFHHERPEDFRDAGFLKKKKKKNNAGSPAVQADMWSLLSVAETLLLE